MKWFRARTFALFDYEVDGLQSLCRRCDLLRTSKRVNFNLVCARLVDYRVVASGFERVWDASVELAVFYD